MGKETPSSIKIDDYFPLYLVSMSIQLPTVKETDAQYSGSSRTKRDDHHSYPLSLRAANLTVPSSAIPPVLWLNLASFFSAKTGLD